MKKILSLFIPVSFVLIIFNLYFFICVDYDSNKETWLCYLFFHLAYALVLLTCFFTTRRRFGVLNSMLYAVSLFYLLIVTVTSVAFLIIKDVAKETIVLISLLELMIFLVYFYFCYLSNRKTEKGVFKELRSGSKHQNWIIELKIIARSSNNAEKVKIVNFLIEEILSSPSSSNLYVYRVDNEIQTQINILRLNFENMQMIELYEHKKQMVCNIRKRTEILKCNNAKI